ncbi:MAG: FlgD immunoglobulin-like domain containing protein [Candidatus Cloacimonadaceae bacterium]
MRLTVYNIKGQKIKELVNMTKLAGKHKIEWNGRDNRNNIVSSGLYFIRIEQDNTSSTKKMMLLR